MMSLQSAWQIWSRPAILGATIVFGLSFALLGGGGVWRIIGWVALAAPLAAVLWFALAAGKAER